MKAIERTQEDMRHAKSALGLAMTAILLGALAVPAYAHEFAASKYKVAISEETPVKTVAKSSEETFQEFTLGKFKLKCGRAGGKGSITSPSSTDLSMHVTYSKCGYYPIPTQELKIGATIKGGISYDLKVNGAAELEGNESGEELEYGTKAELRETAATFKISASKFCTIIVPQQIVPARAIKHPEEEFSFVSYANIGVPVEATATHEKMFPGLVQHKVVITLALKQIKFKYAEETQCGELEKTEGASGTVKGELTTEVVGGNLEFH